LNKYKYEIEYKSETFRVYEIEAESADDAEDLAQDKLNDDKGASKLWVQNATVNYIKRLENDNNEDL
jgi:hypothetical protein